ncbi:MAG: hypothetical protein APG12_00058 [Candidatus Methanofastidiosum methylothiophilum]|uniref:Uncharacterized protein n=1 Tax=Candidatus Methanofastidiosum methylothiophilum TaxID=1705564 RepID=A0A150IMS6_9EURY|nr:MAG: hypothetical protein APG10_00218 [Candidatus Methanofastidiosum methylthiophilus]KYC48748.1 MAG: hypothetical protein APG11_00059 [Candidatus Methanofastidiosum methylthiophilus]KYC51396.1 MAG: hypothetical protein APG12_00058 [Candidatus Methanofastidiosum methylthiophilus]
MADHLMEKLDHIEGMIKELNSKIDNFLGFEEITEEEKEEFKKLREEIRNGRSLLFI